MTVAANLFNTAFGGIFGSRVLPVLVGSSSFGFVGVVFYSGSRVVLEASRQGFLPYDRFFSKVHPRLHTPIHSLVLLYVIALIFLLAPPPGSAFQFIVAFTGYGNYFFSAMSVVGLLILRRTQPSIKRPLKVPIVVAIFFIVICLYTLVFVFVPPETKPTGYPYWCKCYQYKRDTIFNKISSTCIVPYIITIILALVSIGLWYYKMVYKDALVGSYNAEIRLGGQQELFDEVYRDRLSSVSSDEIGSIQSTSKSVCNVTVDYNSK